MSLLHSNMPCQVSACGEVCTVLVVVSSSQLTSNRYTAVLVPNIQLNKEVRLLSATVGKRCNAVSQTGKGVSQEYMQALFAACGDDAMMNLIKGLNPDLWTANASPPQTQGESRRRRPHTNTNEDVEITAPSGVKAMKLPDEYEQAMEGGDAQQLWKIYNRTEKRAKASASKHEKAVTENKALQKLLTESMNEHEKALGDERRALATERNALAKLQKKMNKFQEKEEKECGVCTGLKTKLAQVKLELAQTKLELKALQLDEVQPFGSKRPRKDDHGAANDAVSAIAAAAAAAAVCQAMKGQTALNAPGTQAGGVDFVPVAFVKDTYQFSLEIMKQLGTTMSQVTAAHTASHAHFVTPKL